MKKFLSVFLVLTFLLSLLAGTAITVYSADSDEVIFPDETLREYMVLNFDKDKDGYISKSDITFDASKTDQITIDLSQSDVYSLSGLDEIVITGNVSWMYVTLNFERTRLAQVGEIFNLIRKYPNVKFYVNLASTVIEDADLQMVEPISYDDLSDSAWNSLNLSFSNISSISNLEGYRFARLDISYTNLHSTCHGDNIQSLYAVGANGDLQRILESLAAEEVALSADYLMMLHPQSLRSLIIEDINVLLSNETFTNFMGNCMSLEDLQMRNTIVDDFSVLQSLNIQRFTFVDGLSWTRRAALGSGDFINGKHHGDRVLEQILKIPSITSITMDMCSVTDLTPLASTDKSVSLYNVWVSMDYKNNQSIYNELSANYKLTVSSTYYAGETEQKLVDGQGTDITVKTHADKKYYLQGDNVTYTITLTNNGATTLNLKLQTAVDGRETITYKKGSPSETVSIPAGQSVTKTTTVVIGNDGLYGVTLGSLIMTDDKVMGAVKYPKVIKSGVVKLLKPAAVVGESASVLRVSGEHSSNVKKLEIVAVDGDVLATDLDRENKRGFNIGLKIPEKYWPSDSEPKKTLDIKAITTDTEGIPQPQIWLALIF